MKRVPGSGRETDIEMGLWLNGRAPAPHAGDCRFESGQVHHGLVVQREDARLAVSKSGFDSPLVHQEGVARSLG